LHDLVPCDSAGFFWIDEHLEISNLFAEKLLTPDLMQLYFRRFYRYGEQSFRTSFKQRVQGATAVVIPGSEPDFYRSDYYNLIWRCLDAHHVMYAVIRDRGRVLGQLSLYRTSRDPWFAAAERDRLLSVARYMEHALSASLATMDDWTTWKFAMEEKSGLIVLDPQGKLLQASPEGRRLLFLASHPRVSKAEMDRYQDEVPRALVELCLRLERVFASNDGPPPVLHLDNVWGHFEFRAYRMDATPGAPHACIGVVARHEEPLPVTLLRAMKALPLSAKQKEIILLLARGDSHQQIAKQMNISLNTAQYHTKQVYEKLDVHDRQQLVRQLLQPAR
jgi:DNA-binding CsgD family transcriptional regulator